MNKRYFLSDYPAPAIKDVDAKLGCEVVGSPIIKNKFLAWLKGCNNALKKSKGNDTIVCWFDLQAVILWWMCKLTFRKRRIGAINLMLKAKPTLRNRATRWLYKKALAANNFHASYTSRYYYEWLKKCLGIDFNAVLIHDLYNIDYQIVNRGG